MPQTTNNLLVSCPNGGGMFLLHGGSVYKLDGLDTTGLAVGRDTTLRALQPSTLVEWRSDRLRSLEGFNDIHDVLLDGDVRYVVRTESNEIVQLDGAGKEVRRWQFDGEP